MKKIWDTPEIELLDISATAGGFNQPNNQDAIYNSAWPNGRGDGDPWPTDEPGS